MYLVLAFAVVFVTPTTRVIAAPLGATVPAQTAAAVDGTVVRVSEKGKCLYRCRIVREECSDDNARAARGDDVCWDGYRTCREGCGDFSPVGDDGRAQDAPAGDPASADEVVRNPVVIRAGKWLEGLAFDGRWLWAAESGQRSVARLDPTTGKIAERVNVGRLPTAMASTGDGRIFALVATDKLIWARRSGRDRQLARLGGCPTGMIERHNQLWVLSEPDCSSAASRLTRVDAGNGRQRQTAVLGEWAQALTANDAEVWIAHVRAPALTIVDQDTMRATTIDIRGASLWAVTSNGRSVFAGGRIGEDNDAGVVVAIDPAGRREVRRARLSERIARIVADDDHVVAVGAKGTIWILSAVDLDLKRTITLGLGEFTPSALLFHDDALLVAAGQFRGENGAIFMVGDWRPEGGGKAGASGNDAPGRAAVQPSFDCTTARGEAERAICGNEELAELDAELAEEFNIAVSNITSAAVGGTAADVARFRGEQRDWLDMRNRCGRDVGCIAAAYRQRLEVLQEQNQPE
ncbi:MAG: hypothetical protein KDJ37_14815 [Hyphomicrobiaceae bacterium]|nr:hypothetical protein [Hyphomicrobiaceae bacterium]